MKMKFTTVLCSALLLLFPAALAADKLPNVVVFLTDDQGWGDLSINGNSNLSTPHIDSLGKQGAVFERFFVSPVCSPTRAEFFTGRYHARGGVWNVSTGGERLNLDEKTIGDVFKAAGYSTGAFGKWHNGTQWPYHPNARGFDQYYGFTSGHWGTYFDPPLDHNGRMVQGKGFMTDDLTDHAIAFIEDNRQKPFFCYIPYNTPHSPMQVPDRFYKKFSDKDLKLRAANASQEDLDHTRAALAMCENIDWNVGRVLQKLDEWQLAESTIVIYFSDNGPNGWRWNGGMKGRKGSTDEGGVRSPLLVRWPWKIPAGTKIPQIAAAIDLLPTLAELAGIKFSGPKPLDGRSLKPLLLGSTTQWPERVLFQHWNGKVSARDQRFRLDAAGKLFDMQNDPEQKRDISAAKPEEAARLARAADAWKKEVLASLPRDTRPFPVGYREFPLTQLPARDGVPHGKIKRSAPAPNCSFFENWTTLDNSITWDVEIATSGEYEAVIFYTCPREDAGSTIELSLNDRRLESAVTEPHDPPLTGAEHDRVPRKGESYVKDFKPLSLGTIELEKGQGQLTLRALKIPGKSVMNLRLLTLKLL